MFMQRYIEHFPAGGEIVIFDRSWYNRAGVEYVMGFCTPEEHKRFLELCPQVEKYRRRRRHHPDQAVARGRDGGAGSAASTARIEDPLRQWKLSPMDTESYRSLVRLFAGARHDVQGDRHQARAVAYRPLRRQAAGAAELHLAYPRRRSPTRRSRTTRSSCRSAPTRAATTTRPACAE